MFWLRLLIEMCKLVFILIMFYIFWEFCFGTDPIKQYLGYIFYGAIAFKWITEKEVK